MASVNVNLVRSIFATWERGDYGSAEWAHPEIDYVIADGPSPGSWAGVAGMWEGWHGVLDAWEELRFEADEYRALDDERVLVLYRWSGRGKGSGLDIGQIRTEGLNLFYVRDGKVTRMVNYLDRERGCADLGRAAEGGAP
jgi:ketosteroid isomerase-like protein